MLGVSSRRTRCLQGLRPEPRQPDRVIRADCQLPEHGLTVDRGYDKFGSDQPSP
jgi:hypothetical protein